MSIHENLLDLRKRILAGEEVSAEEYQNVLDQIRGYRERDLTFKGRIKRWWSQLIRYLNG